MPVNLTTSAQSVEHVNMVVYGESGVGKTVLSTTLPKPVIISAERGLMSISDSKIPVIVVDSLNDVKDALNFLKKHPDDYESVVIDSLSEVAEIILADMKRQYNDGRAAYGHMNDHVNGLFRALRALPFHVYLIAKESYVEDEKGVTKYVPSLPGKTVSNNLPYAFDMVFCMRMRKDKDGKDQRYLQTQPDVKYSAKDRSGKLLKRERPHLGAIINKILQHTEKS